jgi:hypothetical protein
MLFKKGDRVKIIDRGECYTTYDTWAKRYGATNWDGDYKINNGDICKVVKVGKHLDHDTDLMLIEEEATKQQYIFSNDGYACKLIQTKENKMKEFKKPKFMVYGTGCNNTSELFDTKKEAVEYSKEAVHDGGWTGDILIYELKPLNIVEKTVKLKSI